MVSQPSKTLHLEISRADLSNLPLASAARLLAPFLPFRTRFGIDIEYIFQFLSDPSPIIGNACHSKLAEVVTVTHVDDEKRADNSLVQIWKVKFGPKVKFLFIF